MDKIKKYLKDHEEHLSIEKVSDEVWNNVERGIRPQRIFFSKKHFERLFRKLVLILLPNSRDTQSKELHDKPYLSRTNQNIKWAFALLFPLFFIFSCSYRIDRVEVIGKLVSFSIQEKNVKGFQQLTLLQGVYRFDLIQFKAEHDDRTSFIFYLDQEREINQKLEDEIKQVPHVDSLRIVPIRTKISESLLSSFLHRTFQVRLDVKRPGKVEVQELIQGQLDLIGLHQVKAVYNPRGVRLDLDSSWYGANLYKISAEPLKPEKLLTQEATSEDPIVAESDTLPGGTKNETAGKKPIDKIGEWTGQLKDDSLSIQFSEPEPKAKDSKGVVYSQNFRLSEVGLTTLSIKPMLASKYQFGITRAAGTIHFNISVLNTNNEGGQLIQDAIGTFVFRGNNAFEDFLIENGFNDPDTNLMLLCFISNMDKRTIQDLKERGVAKNSIQLHQYLTSIL